MECFKLTTKTQQSLCRAGPVVGLALICLLVAGGLLLGASPAAAGEANSYCIEQVPNIGTITCTANDVRIGTLEVVGDDVVCDPTSGEPVTVTIQATILSGPERYDIGLWINEVGGSARDDPDGTCFREILTPIGTFPTDTTLDCDSESGPYANGDDDSCGDIPKTAGECTNTTVVGNDLITLYTFTAAIACVDSNGDGTADTGTCTSWSQQPDEIICTGVLDAIPGTPAKCECNPTEIGGLVVPKTGTITVDKVLDPADDPGLFNLQIDGTTVSNSSCIAENDPFFCCSGPGTGSCSDASDVGNGGTTNAVTVSAGLSTDPDPIGDTHTVGETAGTGTSLADYDTSISCTDGVDTVGPFDTSGPVDVFVEPDDAWVCTITNTAKKAKLTLVKIVISDDGGNAQPDDFLLTVNGTSVLSGVTNEYNANEPLTINETLVNGYEFVSITGNAKCPANLGGTITLDPGDDITCTITNDDIAATLTLVKLVVNDNGGKLQVADFPLFISGSGATTSGTAVPLSAGAYVASETEQPGYEASGWRGGCDGNVSLAVGDNKTCTITNDDIAPTLTLIKTVTNDNGGTLGVSDFPLFISGDPTTSGTAVTLLAGDYVASETSQAGYTPGSWTGDCDAAGNVTLGVGENKTCTINNDDIAPTLTLIKTVTNDNGGTLGVSDFPLFISGDPATSGTAVTLLAGDYVASETSQAGYTPGSWTGDCDAAGNVTLGVGENKTCTINNDDIAPTLTLIKTVTNDNGGTLGVSDFPLFISGDPTTSGTAVTLLAGDYVASETSQAGYTPGSWTGDCDAAGNVTLGVGENKTCTINNDDIAPTLTLIKTVTNDNGGTLGVSDFPLFISGDPTTSGTAVTLLAGDYVASETSQAGYTPGSWTGDCDAAGNVTLGVGENKTCTINNDDIAPTLTLIKTVTNDNGGTLGVSDFPLFISGDATTSGTAVTLLAGDYVASETSQAGYTPGSWTGDCDAAGNVTLGVGENKTCTINNDDIAPTLTLIKTVTNDNGGTLGVSDFPLFISGDPTTSGTAVTLLAGDYVASETSQAGYTPGSWTGDCDAAGNVTLDVGENKTCTINNDDIAPTLTLIKTVTNDNGGTLGVSDFPLFISGDATTSGTAVTLLAGDYVASETSQAGYTPGSWTGDCDAAGNVTLGVGENKTCTINNDDIAPTLTLIKTVTNDNGGTLGVSDFDLFIDGNFVTSGETKTLNAGDYTASETEQSGYAASAWGTDCDAGGNVTLGVGDNKTCTITNDDIAPTLTLVKTVNNLDGGTLGVSDFPLFISGSPATSGVAVTLSAGDYVASETEQFGYAASAWGTDCDAAGNVSLAVGDNKTCTITNDDIAPTLTLVKNVINDNGGTLEVADFPLFITPEGDSPASATSGEPATLLAGIYTASETEQFGYVASDWTGACGANGTVTLAVGQNLTCFITNDDIQPKLTLVKTVINDNGGMLQVADFPLFVDATPVNSGDANGFNAGTYTASETEQFGYAASDWGGDCAADGSVTLAVGDDKTCTITNDDIQPKLTVIKTVINDDGGTLVASDFTIEVSGTDVDPASFPGDENGTMVTLDAGAYDVTELNPAPNFYAESFSADCSGDIAVGEEKTCTVTNDDIAAQGPSIIVTAGPFTLIEPDLSGSSLVEKDADVDDLYILITSIEVVVEYRLRGKGGGWFVTGTCTTDPEAPVEFEDAITIDYTCTDVDIPEEATSVRVTTEVGIFGRDKVFSDSYAMDL